jgi:hypothetical protein
MAKNGYGWMLAAMAAAGKSGAVLADGDGGDSSMNPFNGDSWATLEGNGHNLGQPRVAPSGAFVAHEMDGQSGIPLAERMRQSEAKAAAFADRMRQQTLAAMHPGSTSNSGPSSTSNSSPDSSSSPSSPSSMSSSDTATPGTGINSGVRIAPVNPKGQAPTIVGPTSSAAPLRMPANTFEDNTGG